MVPEVSGILTYMLSVISPWLALVSDRLQCVTLDISGQEFGLSLAQLVPIFGCTAGPLIGARRQA